MGLVDEPNRPCVEVREVAAKHLAQLRGKLAELQALERDMTAFIALARGVELVQVVSTPLEGGLDDGMQPLQRDRVGHEHPTPHLGTQVPQFDVQLRSA